MKHTYEVTVFSCDGRKCSNTREVQSDAHREEVWTPDGWIQEGGLHFCSETCAQTWRKVMEQARERRQTSYPVDRDGLCHGPAGNNPRHPLDMD